MSAPEVEYERAQEDAAMGKIVSDNLAAILQGRALAQLQRDAYKYTDAGVSVGFRLYDGSYLWNGDSRAYDKAMIAHVVAIGVGSIVEGSDAEVSPEWLELAADEFCDEGGEKLCRDAYYQLLETISDAACELWEEANGEES